MPSSLPSSAGATPQPSVLLLEEYDALAAAIGSALKKFAPDHAVSLARTLAQAEAIADSARPALFIVDVDPPWPGLIDFFERWQRTNPEARVLIIGAPIPKEIADKRGSFGALQFIEKPFELADFGAAIQALLGPWRKPESASPRGTLRVFSLLDVVLLHCASGASVILEVEAEHRRYGEIHILNGQISHAEAEKIVGVEAIKQILTWSEPHLREGKRHPSLTRTIHGPWANLFLELVLRTPIESPAESVAGPKQQKTAPESEPSKKLVVIDDTEMLLIFVEDVLATEHAEWQITTASTGLSGCQLVERILPDLVLLDYSLPDFNGDEVCLRLLQNERTAHVPILMMSGHVAQMKATAARFENVVATIEKPFLSDALVGLVQRTLEGVPPRIEIAPEQVPETEAPKPIVPASLEKQSKPPFALSVPPAKPRPSPMSPLPSAEPEISRTTSAVATAAAPVIATSTEAVLGLFLDVLSMQFTPQLQMGTIRAKPSSLTVSLHLPSAVRDSLPVETGFQLAKAELDAEGHIATVRLIPTLKPLQPVKTRNALEIGDVAVVDGEKRERVQLTPTVAAPMTMQLLAHLDLAGVELSPTFQVSQIALKWRSSRVLVTLSAKASAADPQGAAFEIAVAKLDAVGRITELLLNPIR